MHFDGFRDWMAHPVMSSFVLQWAHSLCDVAYSKKQPVGKVDPFGHDVLSFAREDAAALECAHRLHLFSHDTKLGAKEAAGKGGGRFVEAYANFKKTTGQVESNPACSAAFLHERRGRFEGKANENKRWLSN